MRRTPEQFRRSPHVVAYWRGGSLILYNYATGRTSPGDPLICSILDACGGWRSVAAVSEILRLPSPPLGRLVRALVGRTLLHSNRERLDPREQAMSRFGTWNPEAGFFHAATRDVRFVSQEEAVRRRLVNPVPRPPAVKRYPNREAIDLPPPATGEFARIAMARRTWRRFAPRPVALNDLASVLGVSAGIQQWVQTREGELPLKTSPSGGARHPIECYVVASRVRGLAPGIYHYRPDRHALIRLKSAVTSRRRRRYFPGSPHFAAAPVLVFFTALFDRQLWRYPYSRAYRAALIEAGHVCQTFCLASTSLGLAPFSVMGLADSSIEADLQIDGILEAVLYAAGVGHPPAGASWAPLAKGTLQARPNPRLR